MKTIQPVTVWFNGQEQTATILNAIASTDNLSTAASFSYQLLVEPESPIFSTMNLNQVASGLLTMSGEVYQNWTTNEYAYDWVAEQLNLTITGEYVPPTPPEPQTEA